MKQQSFIFIGRSGCGKGTQIELLIDHLKKIDPEREILNIYTGEEFRSFIGGQSVTQKLAKDVYDKGGLMPEFLTVNMWTKPLIEGYNGNQHIIFDGTPRKYHEAGVLHSMFGFYGIGKPFVINIDITPAEAMKRLLLRKRLDDSEEDIKRRLDWYESDVTQTVDFYRDNPSYNYIQVEGERSIEAVHEEVVKRIGLD